MSVATRAPGGWLAGLGAAALAIPAAYLAHRLGGFPATALVVILSFGAGFLMGQSELVSRFAGQCLALTALSGGLWFAGVAPHIFPYPGWLGGFVLCQIATYFIGLRLSAPWRDMTAGLITVLIVLIGAGASHGWFS